MSGVKTSDSLLGDFRTDARMLLLIALAIPVGLISALVAKALLWLIAEITNIVFFQRFSSQFGTLQHHHLGAWVIVAPVAGASIIGLMARYGSEKIRGHGIPEALEAILLGGSLIQPKVAMLKPISSAISIGTGGPFGAEGPIIMTGGAFGSILAQLFHLTAAERKTLLVAGAAGGMAAVFAAPVAATLARGRVAAFRMAAAQFHSGRNRLGRRWLMRVPLIGAGPIFPIAPHAPLGSAALSVSRCVDRDCGWVWFRLTDHAGLYFRRRLSQNCRSIGCGGRRSAACLSASAAGSIRACSASVMN